jgi:hypothetical protein
MSTFRSVVRGCLAVALGATPLSAQTTTTTTPWKVTLTPPINPVPIGSCGLVQLALKDASGKDTPRNPQSMLITMADFDMSATSAVPKAAAGHYLDAHHFVVCGCQGGTVGSAGTVTAIYPAASLPANRRVPGVAFQASAPFTLGTAQGTVDSQSCTDLKTQAVAVTPVAPTPASTSPGSTPAATPAGTAPGAGATPVAGRGNPRGIVGTNAGAGPSAGGPMTPLPGQVQPTSGRSPAGAPPGPAPAGITIFGTPAYANIRWQPVAGAASIVLTRQEANVAPVQQTLPGSSVSVQDVGLRPATAYTYTVSAIQSDGRTGTATAQFTSPSVANVTGFTGTDQGSGKVRLTWQPATSASYYVLFGPGSPTGGVRVNATTYLVTGAPGGSQSWRVATYYDPGPTSAAVPVSPNAVSSTGSTATVTVAGPVVSTAKMTAFDPEIHGFRFTNDFSNSFIGPPVNMTTGGLCGGMTYAVLDYYNAGRSVPNITFRPANNSNVQQFLYQRQVSSLVDNLDKWIETSVNPLGSRTQEFFDWGLTGRLTEIQSFIDRGVPVPLGLKGPGGGIGGDHQVLAIGYDLGRYQGALGPFQDDVKIFVFDPNYPMLRRTLIADAATLEYRYLEGGSSRWRTYFVDGRYQAAVPPATGNKNYPANGLAYELRLVFATGADDMRGGADHVDLELTMTDNSVQTYTDISNGGRWLPNYTETVQLIPLLPFAPTSIRSARISTNATGGPGGDIWELTSLQLIAFGNGVNRTLLSTPAGPFRFSVATPSLTVPVK